MGRPSKYSDQLADEICERLSKGEPLAVICRDEHMPDRTVVWDWTKSKEEFSQRIARAREDGYDSIAIDCLHIADETGRDTIIGDSGGRPDAEWITRSRLRVETRLKLLAKWCPKKYGEKIEHEVTGDIDINVVIGGNAKSDG